jgi:hypothetical protein
MSESGSSYKSSIQVPPFTGVPVLPCWFDPCWEAPQALNSSTSTDMSEKAIMTNRGFLGIISSLIKTHMPIQAEGCIHVV